MQVMRISVTGYHRAVKTALLIRVLCPKCPGGDAIDLVIAPRIVHSTLWDSPVCPVCSFYWLSLVLLSPVGILLLSYSRGLCCNSAKEVQYWG